MSLRPYPEGQELKSVALEYFERVNSTLTAEPWRIYCRDARPFHLSESIDAIGRDSHSPSVCGLFRPFLTPEGKVAYRCSQCHQITAAPIKQDWLTISRLQSGVGQPRLYRRQVVIEKSRYLLKLVVNLRDADICAVLAEIEAFLGFLRKARFAVGKRRSAGFGTVALATIRSYLIYDKVPAQADGPCIGLSKRVNDWSKQEHLTFRFLANMIPKHPSVGLSPEEFLNGVRSSARFFDSEFTGFDGLEIKLTALQPVSFVQQFFFSPDQKAPIIKKAIPRGAEYRLEIDSESREAFLYALAIAERCGGIGRHRTAGKGEFRVI
jgi:hypothetical protein